MRRFENNVSIAGILVKHTLEETTYGDGIECIRGEVIIRTEDGGEHEVKFFANKYKKGADGNFTSDENQIYKSLVTVMSEYKTLEEYPDDPDFVQITSASFGVNDYVSKNTGEITTINPVSSNFINRVDKSKIETTPSVAKFEVEGVIDSIKDETIKNEPTGNLIVTLNVINQTRTGTGKDAVYEVKNMFPLRLFVTSDLADNFRGIYSEGCFTKLSGVLINKTETVTKTETQAFGSDLVKTFTNIVRHNEITSGSAPISIYEAELTDDICNQLISQRKAVLAEVKNGKTSTATSSSPAPSTGGNPFAAKTAKNPFAKK